MFIRTVNKLLNSDKLIGIELKTEGNINPEPSIVFTIKIAKKHQVTTECAYQSWEIASQVFEELSQAIERGALLFDVRR